MLLCLDVKKTSNRGGYGYAGKPVGYNPYGRPGNQDFHKKARGPRQF